MLSCKHGLGHLKNGYAATSILIRLANVSETWDLEYAIDEVASEEAEYEYNDFQYMPLTGLVNDGRAGKRTCEEMKYEGRLRVQESFYLEDDLTDVARTLEHHPMIIISGLYIASSLQPTSM